MLPEVYEQGARTFAESCQPGGGNEAIGEKLLRSCRVSVWFCFGGSSWQLGPPSCVCVVAGLGLVGGGVSTGQADNDSLDKKKKSLLLFLLLWAVSV